MVGVCGQSYQVEIYFLRQSLAGFIISNAFKIFQYRKYLKPFFCVKDLLTFYLAQPTPPNTEERQNADLGEGRGFKDITKFAKVFICIFVLFYFCINFNADLG